MQMFIFYQDAREGIKQESSHEHNVLKIDFLVLFYYFVDGYAGGVRFLSSRLVNGPENQDVYGRQCGWKTGFSVLD
jgi:hypothetical protein